MSISETSIAVLVSIYLLDCDIIKIHKKKLAVLYKQLNCGTQV